MTPGGFTGGHAGPEADFHLLSGRRHMALAVSGGSDSMAMLALAADWQRRQADPPRLSVLTVDHGLRPEAACESQRVAGWSATIGIPHHLLAWQGQKPATGIQAKARQARYALMTAWCRENGADSLLTAHTLDDQAETVLMRLGRTKSPESLAGIPQSGEWHGIPVLRPVLGVRRADLRAYLTSIGQNWIDDPSNDDPRFERVRIRKTLGGERLVARLAALAQRSSLTAALIGRCAERWIADCLSEEDAGICFASSPALQAMPEAVRLRILGLLIRHYGGGHRPERAELARLAQWLSALGGQPRVTLGGAVIGKRNASFWITREAARIAAGPVVVRDASPVLWDNRFLITAPKGSTVTAAGSELLPWTEGTPVHARRSCPNVLPPPGASGGVKVEFVRLKSLNGTFTPLASLELR